MTLIHFAGDYRVLAICANGINNVTMETQVCVDEPIETITIETVGGNAGVAAETDTKFVVTIGGVSIPFKTEILL